MCQTCCRGHTYTKHRHLEADTVNTAEASARIPHQLMAILNLQIQITPVMFALGFFINSCCHCRTCKKSMENEVAKQHNVEHHMDFRPYFEQSPVSLGCVECQGTRSFLSSGLSMTQFGYRIGVVHEHIRLHYSGSAHIHHPCSAIFAASEAGIHIAWSYNPRK